MVFSGVKCFNNNNNNIHARWVDYPETQSWRAPSLLARMNGVMHSE